MAQASPMATPLPFGHQLAPPISPSSSSHPYAELIGSLMYAMMCTRPDLAYPISMLAHFVGTGHHTEVHWKAAKRVLRYLRGTKDHALTLGGSSPPLLSGFSDSSWADSQPDRRSSHSYGFTLGSGLVSLRSTCSSSVSLSSCEAELYAGTIFLLSLVPLSPAPPSGVTMPAPSTSIKTLSTTPAPSTSNYATSSSASSSSAAFLLSERLLPRPTWPTSSPRPSFALRTLLSSASSALLAWAPLD
ncbi:unnamed protein product [Closterium sp. NIES-53]